MCKKEGNKYEKKYCLCCLPLWFAMCVFTFIFSCDWIGALVNVIKADVNSLPTTTFWFLLKTNLITSFYMVWTNLKVQEAREILFRSFILQYICEVVFFIANYIYYISSDEIKRQCDRWYQDDHLSSFLERLAPADECVNYARKGGLSAAAILWLCVYTPIRLYALRNIYYFKEELKHENE